MAKRKEVKRTEQGEQQEVLVDDLKKFTDQYNQAMKQLQDLQVAAHRLEGIILYLQGKKKEAEDGK